MTTSNIENQFPTNLTESCTNAILGQIGDASEILFTASKEKYEYKNKLIVEAKDMSTQEKLDAMDKNYDRHNQEVQQNIVLFGVIGLAFVGAVTGSPTIIKSIRRLVA